MKEERAPLSRKVFRVHQSESEKRLRPIHTLDRRILDDSLNIPIAEEKIFNPGFVGDKIRVKILQKC